MAEQVHSKKIKRKAKGSGRLIYRTENVLEASLERIRRIYDEFPNVAVHVSGGKDSTVILHLALQVATEKNRLPVPIYWVDQEAEWQATVDIVRDWMGRPDVEPHWLQVPFKITNATSRTDQYFHCWDPEREADWMRPKDPLAIHENPYGEDRFVRIFDASLQQDFEGPAAALTGVRTEESPGRLLGITSYATYKDITWGRKVDKIKHKYVFHPLYDWGYRDVWKAIFDNGWPYNRIYDEQYRLGTPTRDMRVSSLQHETATKALFILQEFEPDTYERLVDRIEGVDAAGKIGKESFKVPVELPPMFKTWFEYRDYLAENLLEPEACEILMGAFKHQETMCPDWMEREMCRIHIRAVLTGDTELTTLRNWRSQRHVRLALTAEVERRKLEKAAA